MPKDYTRKEKNKELIEIAAEQFAYLFWRQYQYIKKEKKGQKNKHKKSN